MPIRSMSGVCVCGPSWVVKYGS